MKLFNEDERVARIYTIRRTTGESGARISRNRHHFLLLSAGAFGGVAGCFNSLQLAERHMMISSSEIIMSVAVMLQKSTELLEDLSAICHYGGGAGGRKVVTGAAVAEFPVVLYWRKFCGYGGVTRLLYEGCLEQTDLVHDDAPRVHLAGGYDWTSLVGNYYNSYISGCPLAYIAPRFVAGDEYPTGYRFVEHFGAATAERLTSIPQAQQRKTYRAKPYRLASSAAIVALIDAGAYAETLAHGGYPTVSAEARASLIDYSTAAASIIAYVNQYYGDGQERDDAPCWRPTSGLNPHTIRAALELNESINALFQYVQTLSNLPADEFGRYAATDIENASPLLARAVGLYMLFLDHERFTGTPNYIPAALSQCRGDAGA